MRIVLKLREGTRVRLRDGRLTAVAEERNAEDQRRLGMEKIHDGLIADELGALNDLLTAQPVAQIGRLFVRPETDLDREKVEGEQMSGRELADLNLYYTLTTRAGSTRPEPLIDSLNALRIVEVAYQVEEAGEPACADIAPVSPSYTGNQSYLGPAPNGIDANYAWTFAGGAGSGVKLIDVERGWNLNHEDLPVTFLNLGVNSTQIANKDHGTAELGIVAACNNGFGVTGIANAAQVGTSGICSRNSCPEGDRTAAAALDAAAIDNAAGSLGAGDVIWIATHINSINADVPDPGGTNSCLSSQYRALPVEYRDAEFDAISAATAKGITVVEAAGNGSMDLDSELYEGRFDRSVRDSGAIMVGAGQDPLGANVCSSGGGTLPATPRAPMNWSNHGSRVDIQAWGNNVMTAGYGTCTRASCFQVNGLDQNQWYTNAFSGTSSAVAMVAGTVAAVQGVLKAQGRPRLKPAEIRDLLVATGVPQQQADLDGDGVLDTRYIGPQPNLRAAINQMLPVSMASGYFNDDAYQDLAIGIPYESVNRVTGAGKVIVLMGSAAGLDVDSPIEFSQAMAGFGSTPETGDFFGFSVTTGDFDGNGRDDLAVGAPFEDVGSVTDSGAVNIIYSDNGGLNTALGVDWLHQDSAGVPGVAQAGDHFGFSLAAGDFDGNRIDDLAIGVPSENVTVGAANMLDAGAVNVIYGDASGLNASFRAQSFDQSHPADVPGTAEAGDRFGFSLAAGNFDGDAMNRDDLAIGVPFENVSGASQAGSVNVIYSRVGGLDPGFRTGHFYQPLAAGLSNREPGDLFGYALAVGDFDNNGRQDLAIGVPGEDVFDQIDAGAVDVIYSDAGGLDAALRTQEFHERMASIPGVAQSGDRFGAALAAGDFDNSRPNYTLDDLAIGIPGKDIGAGALLDAGAIVVIHSQGDRLDPDFNTTLITQDDPDGLPTVADQGEHFGGALAAGRFNSGGTEDLAIGALGERFGLAHGYALVIYGGLEGLSGDSFTEYPGL